MTDSDLTPEQEAVRRLLAEARHDEPVPPAVVVRLDETLARLVADRGEDPLLHTTSPAPVVDLGARRRRIAGMGLLAAAAVVVAGVALGQVLPSGSGDSGSGSADGGGAADSSTAQDFESGDSSAADDPSAGMSAPNSMKSVAPFADAPAISSADPALEQQLLDLRDQAKASRRATAYDATSSCTMPALGPGRRLLVEVDGLDGVAVFRVPDGTTQQVDVYACADPQPVRTLTLPAP
jgi:hypothetical protein